MDDVSEQYNIMFLGDGIVVAVAALVVNFLLLMILLVVRLLKLQQMS